MVLQRLLGDVSARRFLDEFYLRLPFSLPGGAREFVDRADWSTVEAILSRPEAEVMVVRGGRRREEASRLSPAEARALFDEGWTLLVRHAERHDDRLAELAREFTREFQAAVDVHLYCTPAGTHGFGWHYDAEDVFILQTTGRKEYALRKNTVNPWPLVETLPSDMKYERELMPLMKCLLAAGDWLYIPHGYWHVGRAEEDAISLAVGVLSPSGIDVLDFLRERLPASILWRRRLPATGIATEADEAPHLAEHRRHIAQLAEDLSAQLHDEAFLRQFLAWRERRAEKHAVSDRPVTDAR